MSENLKTIKELAEELGISKQGIRYHMKYIPQKEFKKNDKGIVVLNIEQQNIIKKRANSDAPASGKSDAPAIYKQEIIFLEEKNLIKDKQIDYLKQQIQNYEKQVNNLIDAQKHTQKLLDQQQQLALQDKNLLEEYKSEIKSLKSLNLSGNVTEIQKKEAFESKDDVNLQEQPKKWWHLWR